MIHFLKDRALLFLLIISLVVFLPLYLFLPMAMLMSLLNSVLLATITALCVAWGKLVVRAMDTKPFDDVSQLTVGSIIPWAVITGGSIVSVVMIADGAMSAPYYLQFVAVLRYIAIMGGLFQLAALGVMKYNKALLVASGVLAVTIFIATLLFQFSGH